LGDPIVGPMEHQDYQERVVVGEQDKNSVVVVVVATVAVDGVDLVLVAAVLDTVTVAAAVGNGVVESLAVVVAVVVVVVAVAGPMEFVAADVLIDSTADEVVEEVDHVVVVVVADLVAVCWVGHLHVVVGEMHRDAAVAVADENFYAVLVLVHSTCHVVVQIEMAVVVVDSDVEDVVLSKVVGEHFLLHLPSAKEVVPNLDHQDRQDHCDHFGH
jgi:hypothetical protein